MNSNWEARPFSTVAVLSRETAPPEGIASEEPYVGLEHIKPDALRLSGLGTGSEVASTKLRFRSGDVLFGKLRPYFRKVARPRFDGVCSTDIWVMRPKEPVDAGFLFYLVSDQRFVDFVNSGATGTRMPRANWGHAGGYVVRLPPHWEQRAIAELLGSLDDRIEWCRDGQALLRSLLHVRFQRDFRVGESVRLGDVTETVPGRSYKSADLDEDSPVGLVNLKNIPRHGGFNPVGVKGYTGAYRPAQVVRQGELVVACTDMTQQGDVIGRVGRVRPNPAYPTMVISMDMAAVRPAVPWLSSEYLAEVLSTREYVDHAKRYVNGTTVLHMKKIAVAEYETELPEPEAVAAFTEFARPMWERHDLLDDEAHALTQLRDALLPKLLSGELLIENPERLLEGVA